MINSLSIERKIPIGEKPGPVWCDMGNAGGVGKRIDLGISTKPRVSARLNCGVNGHRIFYILFSLRAVLNVIKKYGVACLYDSR